MSDADLFTDQPAPVGGDLFTDEPKPRSVGGFLENVVTNAAHDLNPVNLVKGAADTVKTGLYDLPKAALQSSADLLQGTAHAVATGELPEAEDVAKTPILEKTREMTEPIAKDPVGFLYNKPVDAALLAGSVVAPFLGAEGASVPRGEVPLKQVELPGELPVRGTAAPESAILPEVPRGQNAPVAKGASFKPAAAAENAGAELSSRLSEAGKGPEEALRGVRQPEGAGAPSELPKTPSGGVDVPPASPGASLPVVDPGAKVGKPHALFAYNDNFGPNGAARSIYNIFGNPEDPAIKSAGGFGSSVTKDILDKNGIPVVGREPRSVGKWEPLDQAKEAPKAEPPPAAKDPLQDVKDYINSKYQTAAARPGVAQKLAKILEEESTNLGAKDLGLMGRQVQSMGQGFEGLEKAKQLVDYAREKGYFDPTLTDIGRKDMIVKNMKAAGQQMDAIRNLADQRGTPPVQAIKDAVKQQLEADYGTGVEKAPAEIKNVMEQIDKAKPTFSGMSELATKLNKSATNVKSLGQHPGPTTDAANIVSRINNDAIRSTLNPQESELYTKSLRDYGAHKKLEQATAAAGRRGMVARTNQRGILGRLYQEALDRGGYRIGGNIANKTAQAIMKNPKVQTLPQFFEELAHQANEAVDETISGMYQGGRVPDDVRKYAMGRGC